MLFLDEIQYLRDWERHLKVFVDDHPDVRCVASGSAAAALRLKSIESGAGRFTNFLLPPLTFYEYLDLLHETDLVEKAPRGGNRIARSRITELNRHFLDYINFGGYPEAALSDTVRDDPQRYIGADIIEKVLLRDLPSLYGIQDVQELNDLFTTLAFNTAGEVSPEALAQNSGVTKPTLKRYLEYLEAAFLIRVVHRIDRNARRFKRASRFKVYVTTPALRAALFGPVTADDPAMGAPGRDGGLRPVVPRRRRSALRTLGERRSGYRPSRRDADTAMVHRRQVVGSTRTTPGRADEPRHVLESPSGG